MLEIVDHRLYSKNRVRELSICRPPVNAFNLELLDLFGGAIADAQESGVGALVLSGREGVFSAGLDLKEAALLSHTEIARTLEALRGVTLAIGRCEIPIAAAITGGCLGAGAVFSLYCDYRVMNSQSSRFGITEVRGGMTVGRHVVHALARIVGEHRAQQLIMNASAIDARRARELGLADELASARFVVSRAVAWCDRALKLPRGAMLKSRKAARDGMHRMLAELEAEPIDDRLREWSGDEAQSNLSSLLTT